MGADGPEEQKQLYFSAVLAIIYPPHSPNLCKILQKGVLSMPTLDQIRACFAGDHFAVDAAGVTIDIAEPGRAVCSMAVRPGLLNANSVPMGGAIFTLADFAFAVAANGHSTAVTVTQQVSVTFLAASRGKVLTAEASCIRAGRRTCLYAVDVTDELGTRVAHLTINGYTVDPKPVEKA